MPFKPDLDAGQPSLNPSPSPMSAPYRPGTSRLGKRLPVGDVTVLTRELPKPRPVRVHLVDMVTAEEGYLGAVGRPGGCPAAGSPRAFFLVGPVRVHCVDVLIAGIRVLGGESYLLAIWGPIWLILIDLGRLREVPLVGAVGGVHLVDIAVGVGYLLAVWRPCRIRCESPMSGESFRPRTVGLYSVDAALTYGVWASFAPLPEEGYPLAVRGPRGAESPAELVVMRLRWLPSA
jgi:hypothetical protein